MNKTQRKQWIADAVTPLRLDLESIAPVPPDLTLHVGFPARFVKHTSLDCLGCCNHRPSLQIFISPTLTHPLKVLAVLAHELIHASLGWGHDHDEVFEKAAQELGFVGEMDAASPGPELTNRLNEISNTLGSYPKN